MHRSSIITRVRNQDQMKPSIVELESIRCSSEDATVIDPSAVHKVHENWQDDDTSQEDDPNEDWGLALTLATGLGVATHVSGGTVTTVANIPTRPRVPVTARNIDPEPSANCDFQSANSITPTDRNHETASISAKLCGLCQTIFNRHKDESYYSGEDIGSPFHMHHSFSQLWMSSKAGCALCNLVLKGISRLQGAASLGDVIQNSSKDYNIMYQIQCGSDPDNFHAAVLFRYATSIVEESDVRISLMPFKATSHHKRSNHTSFQSTFQTTSHWLHMCDTDHDCLPNADVPKSVAPTRLLEIGDTLRLRESAELPDSVRYTTLSYCWGGNDDVLRLTSKTIAGFKHSIPVDQLPLTIQHAIHATKGIGIRYTWIDSLCIIQDSSDDWEFESVSMWRIYSHSYCTLAATFAKASNEGLFQNQHTPHDIPCTIAVGWKGFEGRAYNLILDGEWKQGILNAPLNQRGWVYQERLLSRRIIHFTESEVYWTCGELSASEQYSMSQLRSGQRTTKSLTRDQDTMQTWWNMSKVPRRSKVSNAQSLNIWQRMVWAYTRCALTRSSDRLVAIGGLARMVHMRLGLPYSYVAGMFGAGIEWQILWENLEPWTIKKRPEVYQAPSWSWASVDRHVRFNCPRGQNGTWETKFTLVIDAKFVHADVSSDYFGPVTDGRIDVKCQKFKVQLHALYQRDKNGRLLCDAQVEIGDSGIENHTVWVNADEGLETGQPIEKDLFFMPVESAVIDRECAITGLVLVRSRKKADAYERWGLFKKWNDHKFYDRMVRTWTSEKLNCQILTIV